MVACREILQLRPKPVNKFPTIINTNTAWDIYGDWECVNTNMARDSGLASRCKIVPALLSGLKLLIERMKFHSWKLVMKIDA
jgi:hypothetical protein